ncbi:MAG: chemotaxis protein CheW [Bacteroidota bacterium]
MNQAALSDIKTRGNNSIHPESTTDLYVIFHIDAYAFALPLMMAERIFRAVKISHFPKMPAHVLGLINVHGSVIPVFNIRHIFGLPQREVKPEDQLIIASSADHRLAFMADRVTGVTERTGQQIVPAKDIYPGLQKMIDGIILFHDGLILIYKPEKIFDMDTLNLIDLALMQKANASTRKAITRTGKKKD